jgi:hypothetical protein
MKRTKAVTAFFIIFSFAGFGMTPVNAQQTKPLPGAWNLVEAVEPGENLEVRLNNGDVARGKFNGLSATTLILLKGNSLIETDRARISKIYRVGSRQVGKSTLIGLAIGTGTGAVIGGVVAATDGPTESGEEHLPILFFGAAGAIIGTATGAVTGLFRKKRVLIYESP